jgi:hypothetical protein
MMRRALLAEGLGSMLLASTVMPDTDRAVALKLGDDVA